MKPKKPKPIHLNGMTGEMLQRWRDSLRAECPRELPANCDDWDSEDWEQYVDTCNRIHHPDTPLTAARDLI